MTFCPAVTLTAVTVPDTAKFKLACAPGSIVPEVETVCFIVPVVTVTRCVVTSNGEVGVCPDETSSPTVTPMAARTAAPIPSQNRLRRQRRARLDRASVARSSSASSVGRVVGTV